MIGPSLSVVHTVPSWRRKLAPALFDGSCCFGGEESAAETEQAYALKLTAAGLNAVGADARGQLVGRDARVDRTAQAPLGRQILHRGGFPSDAPCAVLAPALASA